jgi:HAD superfamily hydrolase (TIGR01509 family)
VSEVPALVIFDHDGVLVDSEIIAMELLASLATEHGRSMSTQDAFDRYLGTSFDYVLDDVSQTGAFLDREALRTQFHADLFDGFRTRLEVIPGVPDLLAALTDAGRAIAIASSGSRDRVTLGITSTGIAPFFDDCVITTAEDVERGKPHPDLFLVAAERAGVQPEECIVIEDSPFGVEAAHRAGMQVIGLAYRTPADRLADAHHVIRDPRSLVELLLPEQAP